jgi:hypothetical protein
MTSTAANEVEQRYLDYTQSGRYCGVSRWSLFRAAKSGHLRRYGSAASPRFLKSDLDSWMRKGAPTAAVEGEE